MIFRNGKFCGKIFQKIFRTGKFSTSHHYPVVSLDRRVRGLHHQGDVTIIIMTEAVHTSEMSMYSNSRLKTPESSHLLKIEKFSTYKYCGNSQPSVTVTIQMPKWVLCNTRGRGHIIIMLTRV
jgi:hypothetical protein